MIELLVVEGAESFTRRDGTTLWAAGYTPVDPLTRDYLGMGDHRVPEGCLLCRVAGTSHTGEALQDPAFAPGSPLTLRPEPDNPHDPNAVGVWDAADAVRVGWVPADDSPAVAAAMREGEKLGGLVLREFRTAEDGPRVGLNMLVGPAGQLGVEVVEEW